MRLVAVSTPDLPVVQINRFVMVGETNGDLQQSLRMQLPYSLLIIKTDTVVKETTT
jgi:hypothetical protein